MLQITARRRVFFQLTLLKFFKQTSVNRFTRLFEKLKWQINLVPFFLELTFFLDEKSNKKIKTICQPEFFAVMNKYYTRLTKNSGSHQIAICHRTET